jgi:hypothetical protein
LADGGIAVPPGTAKATEIRGEAARVSCVPDDGPLQPDQRHQGEVGDKNRERASNLQPPG